MTDASALQTLTNFAAILDYLRDSLDWPIDVDTLDDATYAYSAQELNINPRYAARITDIKQLRPLVNDQAWGIFFVEFDSNRLPVMALRRILQGLAISRRQRDSSLPAWKRDDLLFICVYTSAAPGKTDQRGVTFAHFRDGADGQPELRTFSWDSRETHFYYLRNLNLAGLRWPRDEHDTTAWRDQWRRAFTVTYRYTIRTSEKLASQMAKQARVIRELSADLYDAEDDHGALHVLYERIRHDLLHDLQPDDFADMIAQTITYGAFSAAVQSQREQPAQPFTLAQLADFIPDTNSFLKRMLHTMTTQGQLDLDELGVGELIDLLRQIDLKAITQDFGRQTGSGSEDPVVHFYEQFLNEYDREQRVSRGVFYTPDPVVDYIVRAVDQLLQRPAEDGGFGITDGLASDAVTANGEPLVQILDPATGTGTFLAHVIDHVARRKNPRGQATPAWNDYVAHNLLKRLNGFELMMAPYTIAHLKLGLKLAQTGYSFGTGERLRVFLTNALEKPELMSDVLLETDYLSREANEAAIVKNSKPIMVVIGNPPYSGHSANNIKEDWFKLRDYYFVDGQPLGERNPKWLQDDYVKFIRFGQWRIEQTGQGVLAFITPHGYLDNPTFRGMRQQLMQTFDAIYILDLHGNARKKEVTPDGSKDENVFDIMQGVSIGLFVKGGHQRGVFKADLWGGRDAKYAWLQNQKVVFDETWTRLEPQKPFYLFVPQDADISLEYQQGWKVTSVFLLNNVGIVTGKDSEAIAIDYENTKTLASLKHISNDSIHPLSYRPFDQQFVVYDDLTVTRKRYDVMRHFLFRSNLAMSIGRAGQVIGSEVWDIIFSSKFMTEFNLFRRGGNNLFPLYLYPTNGELLDTSEWPLSEHGRRPNLSRAFVAQVAAKLGLRFVTDGRGDLAETFGPEDIFHYAYAIFHSPTYRTRYAEQLKIDFPRLPLTADLDLFRQLVAHGVDLVALHLLEDDYEGASWASPLHEGEGSGVRAITRFVAGKHGALVGTMNKTRAYDNTLKRIYLDSANVKDASYFQFDDSISTEEAEATWDFQIGGYQVLHKWLYDRRASGGESGRVLTEADLTHYQRVVAALYHTRQVMSAIDAVIESHGGFPLGSGGDDGGEIDEHEEEGAEMTDLPKRERDLFGMRGNQMLLGDATQATDDHEEADYEHLVDGTELEDTGNDQMEPFNPEDIRIETKQFTLDLILRRIRRSINTDEKVPDGINLSPAFQRKAGLWDDRKQSRLIESIFLRIPLPVFYVAEDQEVSNHWIVVDGLQRLFTLKRFVVDKTLALSDLEFWGDDLNGKKWDTIPDSLRVRIEETQVVVHIIQRRTPEQVRFNVFKRINTGGMPLSAQEIRHALNQGDITIFLETLANSSEFLAATDSGVNPKRQADRECVLRFIAFSEVSYQNYSDRDNLDTFFNRIMKTMNKPENVERYGEIETNFKRAMRAARDIFGNNAFRKTLNSRRSPVSKALFEVWSVVLAQREDDELEQLKQRKNDLIKKYQELQKDADFQRAISYSTGNTKQVRDRFSKIETIVQETLKADHD